MVVSARASRSVGPSSNLVRGRLPWEGLKGFSLRIPGWYLCKSATPCTIVSKGMSGSGRARRLRLMEKHIYYRLVARPEPDDTFLD